MPNFQYTGCDCQTIIISFENDVLLQQQSKQGIYQRVGKVNGKTSWISSSGHALWYTLEYSYWIIGNDLGTTYGGIASLNDQGISSCPYSVPNDEWKYWNTNDWIIADANDVSIECLAGNDNYW